MVFNFTGGLLEKRARSDEVNIICQCSPNMVVIQRVLSVEMCVLQWKISSEYKKSFNYFKLSSDLNKIVGLFQQTTTQELFMVWAVYYNNKNRKYSTDNLDQ